MNHEAFAGFRTNAWENPWAGSSSVCVNADWNKYRSCFHRLKVIVKICYLKLAKDVDEDPPIEHGLTVHRRDQVGDFLSSFEMQGNFFLQFSVAKYTFLVWRYLYIEHFFMLARKFYLKSERTQLLHDFCASLHQRLSFTLHQSTIWQMELRVGIWFMNREQESTDPCLVNPEGWTFPFPKLWLLKVIPTCICCPSKESKDCSALYRACSWGRVAGLSNIWWN